MNYKSIICMLLLFLTIFSNEDERSSFWPDEIKYNDIEIIIYQPQLEHYDKINLSARSAISVKNNEKTYFGALWFKGKADIDKENQLVKIRNVEVKDIRFIDDSISGIQESSVLALNNWMPVMTLQSIISDLDLLITEKEFSEQLKNDPPEIIFSSNPSHLIVIDGEPVVKSVDDSEFEYVLNTPHLIVTKNRQVYYLNISNQWYQSKNILSKWKICTTVPSEIKALVKDKDIENEKIGISEEVIANIIVRTKPAELISTNGKPDFGAIKGTNLMYLKNSDANVILDKSTMLYYLLTSGRWFKSDKLGGGEWTFIAGDMLPDDFLKIPKESEISEVRVSIKGTDEANDAVLENQIPQTAEIDRKTKTTEVMFDGDPQWQNIHSTNVSYAINSNKTLLKIKNEYYCVDEGVWFISKDPKGPWEVAITVPEEVYTIPPNEPVYHVRYVHIYDYTPSTVIVGYLPGYHGTYVYHGCVVYGTGYYYKPWHGHHFYSRPWTYGYKVYYHPFYGWVVYYAYPWYWYSYYPYHNHTHYYTYTKPTWKKKRPVFPFWRPGLKAKGKNIYKKKTKPFIVPFKKKIKMKPNNLFVDKKGAVYKKDNVWFKLKGAKWNKVQSEKSKGYNKKIENKKNKKPITVKDYFKSRESSKKKMMHFKKKLKNKK